MKMSPSRGGNWADNKQSMFRETERPRTFRAVRFMNDSTRLATIDDLLKGIPQFQCVEGCSDCCGPIVMTKLEAHRIAARTGQKSVTTDAHLKCSLLGSDGKCSVYDIRPAVCRVFGASESERLVCPHGRKPGNPMTPSETGALMDKVLTLGHGFDVNLLTKLRALLK